MKCPKTLMRILQLCKKFPFPLKDGESIAVTYLSKALNDLGCEITLLSMNTTKHYTDISNLPKEFDHYKEIHFTELDNSVKPLDALANLFSKDSYHVSRFICRKFEQTLIELLKDNEFDVIQLETLYLAPYIKVIKEHSKAIVAMRAHNVEYEIWERITNNTSFLPKRWYLKHLTKKLKRYELDHLNDYDYLIAVSDRDLMQFKRLGYKNGAMASPIGLDVNEYVPQINGLQTKGISFIGALDWRPNIEGLYWFLDNVWPMLHDRHPELTFHVAGRNTPEAIQNLNIPNVVVHGEVPDAIEFINRFPIMVVPLFSGSGMRVKILEGMALGRVIVSTSLGKEGIHASHEKELLIADSPEQFVSSISNAYTDQRLSREIAKRAQAFVAEAYDHTSNASRLLEKYVSLKDKYVTS